jgi:hypothetical protein
MKRRRGRPPEKSRPQPQTMREGTDIAVYGKLGASEAMAFLRDCPYLTIDYIQKMPSRKRDRVDKEYLRRAPEFTENWARRVGPILGKKIAAGDGNFFRELGKAVEERSKDIRPIEDFRRYLAIQYRLICYARGVPFTSKGLRDYYRRYNPRDNVDSSTLSKIMKWARSVQL